MFDVESQITLATYLKENLSNIEFDYLPINIGLKDFDINSIISNYNQLVSDRSKYLSEVSPNNYFIKSIEKQIETRENISLSIQNYLTSLEMRTRVLSEKEKEFEKGYGDIPEMKKFLGQLKESYQ